ncbi:MAG: HAMP domain-containing sensor histidine kinase [Candidatus Sumerlaeia bacterium]
MLPKLNIPKRNRADSLLRLNFLFRVLALILLASLIYALSIYWFRHEIKTQALALARAQAEQTAAAFSRALGDTFPKQTLTLDKQKPESQLKKLVNLNSEIIAALVVNKDGNLVAIHVEERGKYPELVQQLSRMGPGLLGKSEDIVIRMIADRFPDLEPERVLIQRDGQTVGWLRFFVDRSLTRAAVDTAAGKMMANLVTIVIGLVVVVLVATLVIRRQRASARRLQSQRDQARQMAYVGTLAAGLAHEIRNPINALAMQLEMLEEDVGASEAELIGPRLKRIRGGLGALEHTVHDFLTYASPDRQRPKRIELAAWLPEFCAELRMENEALALECPQPRELAVWCDVHGLRQILGNLASNAMKAQSERPECRIAIEVQRQGKWVRIHVDDAGPGIAEEARGRLFEAFFTTRAEGTGLGLPIARRLAEMNGGRLELAHEPSPLGGARFTLTLPAEAGLEWAPPTGA